MAHIFISYSHKDKAYVNKLYEALTARGFDAWIDDRIDYGSEWPKEIQRRLDACDALILVMTPRAYDSKWVHNELSRAQRFGKEVFPLLLDGDGPWLSVESLQYVDVRGRRLPPEDFYDRLEKVAPRSRTLPRAAAPAPAKPAPQPRPEQPKPTKEELAAIERRRQQAAARTRQTLKQIGIGALALGLIGGCIWGVTALMPWLGDLFASRPEPTLTPTRTPESPAPPEPQPGDTRTRAIDGMVEVYVPAGSFDMGSDSGESDERPVHRVTLSAFWIDQTEVTNRMYALCVQAGECTSPMDESSYTRTDYYRNAAYDDYPVIYVTWFDANTYCAWAGGSLPSEAQWEYAARGSDGRTYPWGNDSPNCGLANYYDGSRYCVGDTAEVGSYPTGASPFGALDMAGNVWEWVADRYGPYSADSQTNPQGPASGDYRVLRGGSWYVSDDSVRSANRYGYDPSVAYNSLGFRCARSP